MKDIAIKNEYLQALEERETTSMQYIADLDALIEGIAEAIWNGGIGMDRIVKGGSIGKRTALGDHRLPDLDVVLLLNVSELPISNPLMQLIERSLQQMDGYLHIRTTRLSLEISLLNRRARRIPVDIVPGRNFIPINVNLRGYELIQKQCEMVRKEIKKNIEAGNSCNALSSSLCEQVVNYILSQTEEVREVIRIVKSWAKTVLGIRNKPNGLCYALEIISIYTNKKDQGKCLLITRFLRVLNAIKDLSAAEIKIMEIYRAGAIPGNVLKRPYVMDPTNPSNNLLGRWDPSDIRFFQRAATVTIQRMQVLANYDDIECVLFNVAV